MNPDNIVILVIFINFGCTTVIFLALFRTRKKNKATSRQCEPDRIKKHLYVVTCDYNGGYSTSFELTFTDKWKNGTLEKVSQELKSFLKVNNNRFAITSVFYAGEVD